MKITESQLRSIIRETIINEGNREELASAGLDYIGDKFLNYPGKNEVDFALKIYRILTGSRTEDQIKSDLDKILVKYSDKTPEELDKVIQLFSDVISHLKLYKNPKNAGVYRKHTKPNWMR